MYKIDDLFNEFDKAKWVPFNKKHILKNYNDIDYGIYGFRIKGVNEVEEGHFPCYIGQSISSKQKEGYHEHNRLVEQRVLREHYTGNTSNTTFGNAVLVNLMMTQKIPMLTVNVSEQLGINASNQDIWNKMMRNDVYHTIVEFKAIKVLPHVKEMCPYLGKLQNIEQIFKNRYDSIEGVTLWTDSISKADKITDRDYLVAKYLKFIEDVSKTTGVVSQTKPYPEENTIRLKFPNLGLGLASSSTYLNITTDTVKTFNPNLHIIKTKNLEVNKILRELDKAGLEYKNSDKRIIVPFESNLEPKYAAIEVVTKIQSIFKGN